MPITLAGVELLNPTTELCEWIERRIPAHQAFPWLRPSWPGRSLNTTAVGVPGYNMPTSFVLNSYYHPQSAQRWSYGAFLASARMANLVRAAANGSDGSTSTMIPLTLAVQGQASGESVGVNVNLQHIIPLSSLEAADFPAGTAPNNLVVLVVTDARFGWQSFPCPDFKILQYGLSNPNSVSDPDSPNSTSNGTGQVQTAVLWRDCFNACASALNATIAVDPITNKYLNPDPALNLAGMPIGPVLDALAANVGMRFVANFDGTFAVQTYATASAARRADDLGAAGSLRTLRGGGDQFAAAL